MLAQDRKVARLLRADQGSEHVQDTSAIQPADNLVDLKGEWPAEKRDLEHGVLPAQRGRSLVTSLRRVLVIALTAVIVTIYIAPRVADSVEWYRESTGSEQAETCPQISSLAPSKHAALLENLESLYYSDSFKRSAYEGLSGAIQIPYVYPSLYVIISY